MTMTTTTTKIEQAELLIVEMDAVQTELESTSDYEMFERCKAHLAGLKSDIEQLGYQAVRCVTGWMLEASQSVVEGSQAASTPTVELHEDEQGLYAHVPSSTGKTTYRVGVCAMWLKTVSCTCASADFGKDCKHQVQLDEQLRDIRPTFSEWIAGKGASRETIARLVGTPDRYAKPLKGSGITGVRAAGIADRLAA